MKKKIISLIVLAAALFLIYNIVNFPKTIEKSYKGYYINETEDNITGTCDISIKGTYRRFGNFDFGQFIAKFNGSMTIDGKEYELKGRSCLTDENKRMKDSDGNEIIFVSVYDNTDQEVYDFETTYNFNQSDIVFCGDYDYGESSSKWHFKKPLVATTDDIKSNDEILNKLK